MVLLVLLLLLLLLHVLKHLQLHLVRCPSVRAASMSLCTTV